MNEQRKEKNLRLFRIYVGGYLSFRAVAGQVFSAKMSLTSVFGMGTGVTSSLSSPTERTDLQPQN